MDRSNSPEDHDAETIALKGWKLSASPTRKLLSLELNRRQSSNRQSTNLHNSAHETCEVTRRREAAWHGCVVTCSRIATQVRSRFPSFFLGAVSQLDVFELFGGQRIDRNAERAQA
jgi:hypothetical protein